MSRRILFAGQASFFLLMLALPASGHFQKAHASLDRQIHKEVDVAIQIALETHLSGRSRSWSSPRSGYSGRITPVRTWRSRSGQFCRAFIEVVRLPSGFERNSRGRACRTDQGIWVRI